MNNNIFINCPFDNQYVTYLLKPMLYAVLDFGLEPQLALNRSDSGENRINKIVELIRKSENSIHDLSRIKSSKTDEYYRLNMPFELGIDYGFRVTTMPDKKFLILEAEKYEYHKALSDISGWDIKCHNNQVDGIIECVRSWCVDTVCLKNIKSSAEVVSNFYSFNTDLFDYFLERYKKKYSESKAQEFAYKQIENMTISEYIENVKNFI